MTHEAFDPDRLASQGRWASSDVDIAMRLGVTKEQKILDLGCGDVWQYSELSRRGFRHVVGVDKTLDGAYFTWNRNAVASFGAKEKFVRGDWHALPFGDSTFDSIVQFAAFPLMGGKLSEVHRILKPEGRFIFDTSVWDELVPLHTRVNGELLWERKWEGGENTFRYVSSLDETTQAQITTIHVYEDGREIFTDSGQQEVKTYEQYSQQLASFGLHLSRTHTVHLERNDNMMDPKTYIAAVK